MRIYDIILKKRNGEKLSADEIDFLVNGFTNGDIPDYQMSAFLMSTYFNGMDQEETANLTKSMVSSGDSIDLSAINGIKVDKHSTGGVGDKTTLIIGPIVASCGVPVAKMSGRGLGHTGGTIDKLESIPGFRTNIEKQEFFDIVNKTGIAIIGQSGNIAPADKKIYALRDVTATVDNLSLIASSIMSKKIAVGSDAILLDVKTGSGAFMKTVDDAIKLAESMISIGKHMGRKMMALITNMDIPLGNYIGNSLEVIESINTLKNNGPEDLTNICLELSANMLYLAEKGEYSECYDMAKKSIENGSAYNKFVEMVSAQGGNISIVENPNLFPKAKYKLEITSKESGYINKIDSEKCGLACVALGAGRNNKNDKIDYSAGIKLVLKPGDKVNAGDCIAELYSSSQEKLKQAKKIFLESIAISDIEDNFNIKPKLIYAKLYDKKIQKF